MGLEQRMQNTPEGNLQRKESRDREHTSPDMLAHDYAKQAEEVISGNDIIARDAVARFAKNIVEAREGVEQDEYIERMFNALSGKAGIFDSIPDDKKERSAFALALAKAHIRSLQ